MSTPSDEPAFLHRLEGEVEVDLDLIASSHPDEAMDEPASEWMVDPAEVQRDEIGLRSLLGAVESLEGDARTDPAG
ncbi:hypothetical protein EV643_118154 [Kribbella sp. VKM Ac-2527]|uniref:Uncharacterized protein n=1 Tax=Kribbella caucasensis TaxID=2512215 RepID=A0A4R6K564_9ACTN|nr:hypothetical protein [Kribbella sp. VKM Ac-2527]TDO43411.1 hypothetical protein EV643_118154 [Kribbella sp. VKM Ac-2527]